MPKNSTFHRMPSASVRARIVRFFRPVVVRAIASLLMSILAFPSMFGTVRVSAANSSPPSPIPRAATAPEPFRTATSSKAAVIGAFASSLTTKVMEIVTPPKLPVGFEGAKVPSLTDRAASALAGVTSARSAIRNPKSAIATPPSGTVLFDFDEDGKADIGRWQGSNTQFRVRNSSDGQYTDHTIGSSSAVAAPGDFDGDGKTDAAVFNAGAWTIKKSSNGATQNTSWGTTGDKPVAADYDGDGTTDIAIFRPSTGTWWILKSSDSNYYGTTFGASTDIPITGNWDGDAYADLGVYRPSTGYWHVSRSTAGSLSIPWGLSTDIPVSGDFDGDDKTDLSVYRPSTGAWWIMKSSTGFDGTYVGHSWGNYGDQPVPADYDGDGETDVAVWRPKTGVWYIAKSSEDFEEFEYYSLGVAGNTAVPSAYLVQVGVTVYGDDMANARLSPKNATGGTNLYSRNFSWGTSLVSLPGRSGLDAGFGISYNSLVWTKLGSEMHFDVDQSNVSPGFRIGFPTIEAPYYNDVTSKWSFLMVTPSGARVEFRNTAVTNTYETANSSYTELKIDEADTISTPIEDIGLTVRTTDGTMMTYQWLGGAYRCTRIKDRNGNYIDIDHDEDGTLQTVTDTLGRVITVHYDAQLYPTSVTQTWKTNNGVGSGTENHVWASFTYTTQEITTDFAETLTVLGPANGTTIKVLQKVTYSDGSFTGFDYNGYGQVYKVRNVAADSSTHVLNYVKTNLETTSTNEPDCPRLSQTKSFTENFNGGNEIVVNNSAPESDEYTLPGGGTADAALVKVGMANHPHEVYSRLYFSDAGWSEGLSLATEECIGSIEDEDCTTQKRYTRSYWTQDNTGVAYMLNPRLTESRVSDGTNTKRTSMDYVLENETYGPSVFGLVKTVFIYAGDLTTVLKRAEYEYNTNSAYISRRIIGLATETEVYGTGTNLIGRTTYDYDYDDDFAVDGLNQTITATKHDGTNYGASFSAGRGNLTKTTKWNADSPTNGSLAVETKTLYNVTGSPVAQITPWDGTSTRTVRIGYSDVWNDGVSRTTYAYPTVITDPSSSTLGDSAHSSTVKYRYDIGTNVEANSPAPTGQTYGKKSKRIYDGHGRLARDSIYVNTTEQSYTRYEYPTNGIQSKAYSTIVDIGTSGLDSGDEAMSETWTDGAGRVRVSRREHPGSTGGWAAVKTEFDKLGRVTRSSVPTEVSIVSSTNPDSWVPTGDDDRGTGVWLWTAQKYDWMNRVVRKINTDGDASETENDSDVFISYEGCGCAGGFITTVEGEEIKETAWDGSSPTSLGRRKQKTYTDILGREFKKEIFNWDGSTVYSTMMNTFDERDQVTLSRHHTGTSGTYQDTALAYDGFGRQVFRRIPGNASGRGFTTEYNLDGSVDRSIDARGTATNFTFDVRGLVTEVSHDVPSNSDGLTPFVQSVQETSATDLKVLGGNWSSNVEVQFLMLVSGNLVVVETFSGSELTFGTEGDYQKVEFEVTEAAALERMAEEFGSFVINIVNPSTGQQGNSIWIGNRDRTAATPTVSFEYDNLGNRTEMTDAVGSVEYAYDSLSRLTSEDRTFTAITSRTFESTFTYQINGQLKTVTDPYSAVVTYSYNKVGALTKVEGTGYDITDPFLENAKYRAWGALKEMEYGHDVGAINVTYDSRLRPTEFEAVSGSSTRGGQYAYYADGKLRKARDLSNAVFDRTYEYNHTGLLKEALSGFEARGESNPDPPIPNRPYKQTHEYDVWGNRTGGEQKFWRTDYSTSVAATYVNDRRTGGLSTIHDANGTPFGNNLLNAAGRAVESHSSEPTGGAPSDDPVRPSLEVDQKFDGYGGIAWREEISRVDVWADEEHMDVTETTETLFYLNSAVFGGQTIVEIKPDGTKKKAKVYSSNGSLIAEHSPGSACSNCPQNTRWKEAYLTGSFRYVSSDGGSTAEERDPMGMNTGVEDPWINFVEPVFKNIVGEQPMIEGGGNSMDPRGGCSIDGISWDCNDAARRADTGSALPSSVAHLQGRRGFNFRSDGFGVFTTTRLDFAGYSIGFDNGDGKWVGWTLRDAQNEMEGGEAVYRNWYVSNTTLHVSSGFGSSGRRGNKPWYINGFNSEQKSTIEKQVQFMYSSEACNKAFEAAGLQSLKSMMDSGSLVFVHEKQLSDSSKNSEWLGDDTFRAQMLDQFKKDYEYNGATQIGDYKGNYYVGLRDRAFTGWDNTPVHIIIHELMHAGGAERKMDRIQLQDHVVTNWRTGREIKRMSQSRTPAHDLDWMNYEDGRYKGMYDKVIKACTRR